MTKIDASASLLLLDKRSVLNHNNEIIGINLGTKVWQRRDDQLLKRIDSVRQRLHFKNILLEKLYKRCVIETNDKQQIIENQSDR